MSTVSDEQVAKSAAKTPPPDVFETPLSTARSSTPKPMSGKDH
jgi:hypothetical protein